MESGTCSCRTRGPNPTLDSLDREWPSLYAGGSGLSTRIAQDVLSACTKFRLYKLFPVTS
jgi:hypothetical protein